MRAAVKTELKPLLLCIKCKLEMRLLGIETDPNNAARDIYTFECAKCGRLDARSVRLK